MISADSGSGARFGCKRCIGIAGAVCGVSVPGKGESRVDHIKTRRDRPDLALVLGNLRTLCASCDNQAHREKGSDQA